jgi:ADP-ribosylglycohydrolase
MKGVLQMSKIYDGIMGLVVADALGVPVEFKKRDTFKVNDMIGYGTYNQPPGTWSDDSSMTLATVESIARLGKVVPADIMENFLMWFADAAFTPWNSVFDVGSATRRAITRYASGMELSDCGGRSRMDNGNGSLMRILPLAFVKCTDQDIVNVASLTHAHPVSLDACIIYITVAKNLLNGVPLKEAIYYAANYTGLPEYNRLKMLETLTRDEIRSSGYVVDTLEAAFWCLCHTNTYRDCVLTAVNLGEDTDTVAAVAGGLAGILYGCGGESGIPDEWISQIARKDWIKGLCDKFENKLSR